jgi:hypothetical protein
MAQYTTVGNLYDQACYALLEDWQMGLLPGLTLGMVTEQDWLDYFGIVFQDWLSKTGLTYNIFTQQVRQFTSQYLVPVDIQRILHCFLGGQYLERVHQQSLDDFNAAWQGCSGVPYYWFDDGLPIKTIQIAPTPSMSGIPYTIPLPDPGPPYGEYGSIDPLSGNLTMIGTQGMTAEEIELTMATVIPFVPDSFCHYLGYGVLYKIFAGDSEAKDEQRAHLCNARFQEGVNLANALTANLGGGR